jgi:hypothetical protein
METAERERRFPGAKRAITTAGERARIEAEATILPLR